MKNKVIIFPTDTVYGIGASIYDIDGQNRIYDIKHRPHNKPLAVLCANIEQIEEIAYMNDDAKLLAKHFLPGALTIILKAKPKVKEVTGLDTIGVRIPKYNVAIKILLEYGPMSTTSVNESGTPSINDYYEIVSKYSKLVDEIYKPSDEATSSLPSTVVDITAHDVKILREGSISLEEIKKIIK